MIASLRSYPEGKLNRLRKRLYKYFLKVLAVTATLSAKSVANGNTMNVGCRLNGSAR
jgi:hypothetical protein